VMPNNPAEPKSALWVLEPRTGDDDPRWQDRKIWRKVIVNAHSPAAARLAAEHWALPGHLPGPGNESSAAIAGFRDELLYTVRPAEADELVPLETPTQEGVLYSR
jgi:hypothetical protein